MPRMKMIRRDERKPDAIIHADVLPAFRGSGGGFDYECAGCEATLIENAGPRQFHGLRIKCPKCGTVSEAAPS